MSDENRTTAAERASAEPPPRSVTPQDRVLLLDMWQRSGLTARDFGALVGVNKATLFEWKKRFDRSGPAGLSDKPRGAPTGSRLSEPTQRAILMLKQAHPEWGCDRISDVLMRGEGYRPARARSRICCARMATSSTTSRRHRIRRRAAL